jgi:hypothetical protein
LAFLGQLYACERLPLHGHLALQFYVCEECKNKNWLHMELLPITAEENKRAVGVRCRSQPRRFIHYTPVTDSMDQWTFIQRQLAEDELPDKHLRQDKVGGLFPYDGYDGPKITRRNQMIAQFAWPGIGATVYLYHSAKQGFYPYPYS